MHECPFCGNQCDCDGEDHGQPAPDDCQCPCAVDGPDEPDEADAWPAGDHSCEHGSRWIWMPSMSRWVCVVRASVCRCAAPAPKGGQP